MPGFELFGDDERKAINQLFDLNGGVIFAHGFDAVRNGIYRVREFEKAFALRMSVPYAQAVSSGSAAVKVALISVGVKRGDEVIVPAFTFVATVEAILEIGAVPVVVDIDDTLNIDIASVEAAINCKTTAIIPVHMLGAPANMDAVMCLASRHGLKIVEDNAQGCGGNYKGKWLGTIGDAGAFSLDAGKTIMTGEGGMVLCKDELTYFSCRAYHDHGHEYNPKLGRAAECPSLIGFNYRMTELQGAIGLVQLKKLDQIITAQRNNKHKLKTALNSLPVVYRRILDEGEIGDTIVMFMPTKDLAQKFAQRMAKEGLGTKNLPDALNWHFAGRWIHMHDVLPHQSKKWENRWMKSAAILERSVAIPIMVNMNDDKIFQTAEKLIKIGKELL